MKKILIIIFCLSGTVAFAQDQEASLLRQIEKQSFSEQFNKTSYKILNEFGEQWLGAYTSSLDRLKNE